MRFYSNEQLKYVEVTETEPLPVAFADSDSLEPQTVNVSVTRNAAGDTTKIVETAANGRVTTTNFSYVTVA